MTAHPFGLDPNLDISALRDAFKRCARVRIPSFLDSASALSLHASLRARGDWLKVINSGDLLYELDRDVQATMEQAQVDALSQAVYAGARDGFQFQFESIRVPDDDASRQKIDDPLARLARFMSSQAVLAVLREITGHDDIAFADAQATAYSPGDFLTGHDDKVEGKNRIAAYVLGMTPQWRLEWGGLLLFHGNPGEVDHGIMPGFNTLDVFSVPQLHSVSEVTRAAAFRRYSVTGWLRSG